MKESEKNTKTSENKLIKDVYYALYKENRFHFNGSSNFILHDIYFYKC